MIRRLAATLCLLFACLAPCAEPLPATGTVEAIFTPDGDAQGAILREIGAARRSVRVQAYVFTSREIAKALVAAHRRGVDVEVMADGEMVEEGRNSRVPELAKAGIEVWIEVLYPIAHNKVIIIDGEDQDATVITGSYNFSYAAQAHNAENLLILRGNRDLTRAYLDNWQRHRADALPYAEAFDKR